MRRGRKEGREEEVRRETKGKERGSGNEKEIERGRRENGTRGDGRWKREGRKL